MSEAAEIVAEYWKELPVAYRFNQLLQRQEDDFINWDCSVEGFEGSNWNTDEEDESTDEEDQKQAWNEEPRKPGECRLRVPSYIPAFLIPCFLL